LGFEIGNICNVLVRLFDGLRLWELNRIIDVSKRRNGSMLPIFVRHQKASGLDAKLFRFFVIGDDGTE
jgi:hypothetical protein